MDNSVQPTEAKPVGKEGYGDVSNATMKLAQEDVPKGPRETCETPQELREAPEGLPVESKPSECE